LQQIVLIRTHDSIPRRYLSALEYKPDLDVSFVHTRPARLLKHNDGKHFVNFCG
jgi:hypothetical protein